MRRQREQEENRLRALRGSPPAPGPAPGPVIVEKERKPFEPSVKAIPAGCIMIGKPGRSQHEVCVKSFRLGKYEVTQDEWRAVMGSLPEGQADRASCPVIYVPYARVLKYIRRLNERTGRRYRLPSEAEWEYAARGGRRESRSAMNCDTTFMSSYDARFDTNN